MRELEPLTIRRAEELAADGMPLEQVAKRLNVSRASLYNYGIRSARGYYRRG